MQSRPFPHPSGLKGLLETVQALLSESLREGYGISPRPLDELRRTMNDANIMHWYHESAADVDNDFHLVVSHHDGVPQHETKKAVRAVRSYLAQHQVQVEVGADQMTIIAPDAKPVISRK